MHHSESLTFVLLATNLSQQHAAQLLPPVDVLRVVLLDQAVVVALALGVRRLVELFLRGPISHYRALLVDDVEAVRLGSEDGVEGRQGLRHGGRRLRKCRANYCRGRSVLVADECTIAVRDVGVKL